MQRVENDIYLDVMDELELGQLGETAPESPMTVERAIELYEYLGLRATAHADVASAALDAIDRSALSRKQQAERYAQGLGSFRGRFLGLFTVEYVQQLENRGPAV